MPQVLSIQSHVVHGYVGNRAATFPLQLRGWDVDALNTVNLSNHTGYGKFKGQKTSAEEIQTLYDGLKDLNFPYDALLTGYTPTAEALETVERIGADLKKRFPDLVWLLDPVMGDEGAMYVSEAVIPVYKRILKSGNATLITPNGFEAEILCGFPIDSFDAVRKALTYIHEELNAENVVISSLQFPHGEGEGKKDTLISVGSTKNGDSFYFEYPSLNSYFTGTGDLFAALTLDRFYHQLKHLKSKTPLKTALQQALYLMSNILQATIENSKKNGGTGTGIRGNPEAMKHMELQVICKHLIDIEPEQDQCYECVPL